MKNISFNCYKLFKNAPARAMILTSGLLFMLCAVVSNEFLFGFFDPTPPLSSFLIKEVRLTQLYLLLIGSVLVIISVLIKKTIWLESFMKKEIVVNITLSLFIIILPLSMIEISLRPILKRITTKDVIPDPERGWKLRPTIEKITDGGGTPYVNSKSVRGPELTYDKPFNVFRILYLGDSIVYGAEMADHQRTFPYIVEKLLQEKSAYTIESINAGVCGYSTWQEYIYLKTEGIKYHPDLVILSFCLNDPADNLILFKMGGCKSSYIARSTMFLSEFLCNESIILHFMRRIIANMRFGKDIQQGAIREEELYIESLMHCHDNPEVKKEWNITFEFLDKIYVFCKDRNIPLVLVIFPYVAQFSNISAMSTPQDIVIEHAIRNNIPTLNLLLILSEIMAKTPEHYFVDYVHLSQEGHEIVGKIIAEYIEKNAIAQF